MNGELAMTLKGIFGDKYSIPLYQRNFAWRADEIQLLLQDIYEALKKNSKGKYYIGSLVVLKRHNGDYEVIDGQQRLTVISMIAIKLGRLAYPILTYDSRPEVQEFFELLCRNPKNPEEAMKLNKPSLFYLKEAYEYISVAQVGDENEKKKFLDVVNVDDFFMEHVVLVRNVIPDDTDVAAYFEIMNNRGEQLQKHEIVKSQMMEKIRRDDGLYDLERQRQFARLWDACAQMDIPVQRLFKPAERAKYFGENYEGFSFDLHAQGEGVASLDGQDGFSIKTILDEPINVAAEGENPKPEDDGPETDTIASVIDFPNFLMQVLRLYLLEVKKFDVEVPLNEKELLSVYSANEGKIDSMEFIRLLLFCRTVFDRFVVRSDKDDGNREDGRKWILKKPSKGTNGWEWKESFAEEQKLIIKALSMLQVTFRTRIYKSWLYDVLKWLHDECFESGDLSAVSAVRYLTFLHEWMLNYYDKQNFVITMVPEDVVPTKQNSYSEGTATSHFLLNFVDYLYCCKDSKYIDAFDFKYLNSVEHHLAQNKVEKECPYIDNLGNLCLVSKSTNSRLSDRDPREKAEAYAKGRIGPNRSAIYAETNREAQEGGKWGVEQIRKHYNELVDLLNERRKLLNVLNE